MGQLDPNQERLGAVRERLRRIGELLSRQRHLMAVRDGVVGALPLVLVGSLFLLAAQPPSERLQAWVAPYAPLLLAPYRMLGGAIAVYVTFATAHSLARSYSLDAMASGLLALAAYLVAAIPAPELGGAPPPTPPWISGPLDPGALLAAPPAAQAALPIARLGAGGIFGGIVLAFAAVEVTRFFVSRRWTIRLPGSSPEIVVRSFVALLPTLATILAVFLVVDVARVDLLSLLERLARPLLAVTGSLPAALTVVAIDSGLWVLGVHASAALASLKPLWEAMLVQNMEVHAAAASTGAVAQALPHIASQQFYVWFVWQGGSGATLALALLLLRARSAQLRKLGQLGILPTLCNVNEPILFGAPVVLNPYLAVPFFLVPLCTTALAYAAFSLDWVTRPFLETAWTLPAPLGAFLTTGGDPRAIALQMTNLLVGVVIYWPFVRRYDRALLERERATP